MKATGIARYRWLGVCLGLVFALPVSAGTWYVRANGNDQADGASAKTAFKTVLRAAQVLNYGDNIVIGPGTYRETILIAERYAANGLTMSITGDESGKLTGDAAGPVVIQPASLAAPALRISRARHLVLSGLTFRGPGDGLALEKCLSVSVERCTFSQLRRAVNARLVDGLMVQTCVLERNTQGVSVSGTSNVGLDHNTIVNSSSVGVLALACGPGTIRNSILVGNNTNVLVDASSAACWSRYRFCDMPSGTVKIGKWSLPNSISRLQRPAISTVRSVAPGKSLNSFSISSGLFM